MVVPSSPPQVEDKHIQATLEALWRTDPHPAFLATILAKYSHQEPGLLPLVQELLEQLDEADRSLVLSRLEPKKPAPKTQETEPPEWYSEWLAKNNWPPKPPLEIRVDPELGRLAVGLDKTGEYLVWALARHHFGKPGWVERHRLLENLQTAGIIHTKRHFNRLLAKGAGLFWGLSPDNRVWLRSYVRVSQRLTEIAAQTNPKLVATNIPGARDVYVRVGGDIGDFKAQIYAGWLAYRQDPKIARETLCNLFAVTRDTLRNWEARLGGSIEVVTNYAQTAIDPKADDRIVDYLPEHSYSYVTRRGQMRLRWRQPNRYKVKNIKEHPHKGQSRKARLAAAITAWHQPVETCAPHDLIEFSKVPFDRSHRVPKRYFENAKALKKFLERLARHGRVGISPATPRYVYRGEDPNRHGIYELSLDGEVHTTAFERMPIKQEYGWWAGRRAWQKQARAG